MLLSVSLSSIDQQDSDIEEVLITLLEILEASNIAWPNPGMWRQVPFAASYLHYPPVRQPSIDFQTHGHSPRQKAQQPKTIVPSPAMGSIVTQNNIVLPKPAPVDPFYEPEQPTTSWRHASTSDISMPDYTHISHASQASHSSGTSNSRVTTDPMLTVNTVQIQRHETLRSAGAFDAICKALMPAVPVNTPAEATPPNGQAKKRTNLFIETPKGMSAHKGSAPSHHFHSSRRNRIHQLSYCYPEQHQKSERKPRLAK